MRLYFAYGSNMVRRQMAERCRQAEFLGAAVLPGHRFAISRCGFATVVPQPGASVWGVAWRLARDDEAALDRYEEVAAGVYHRKFLRILVAQKPRAALVYVTADRAPGRARAAYAGAILAAARALPFPEDYCRALDRVLHYPF